jgi:hypothetical protein
MFLELPSLTGARRAAPERNAEKEQLCVGNDFSEVV